MMPDSFLEALDAEIADLENELARNPAYLKLCEAKRLRALYGGDGDGYTERAMLFTPPQPKAGQAQRKRRTSSNRQAILDGAVEIIGPRGSDPTKTADVLDELIAKGIEVPGNTPRNSLSAMLSTSDLFVSHGRSGWTLVENESGTDESSVHETTDSGSRDAWGGSLSEPSARDPEAGPAGDT